MTAICAEGSNPLLKLTVKPRTFILTPAEVAQGPTVGEVNSTSFNEAASGARSFFQYMNPAAHYFMRQIFQIAIF